MKAFISRVDGKFAKTLSERAQGTPRGDSDKTSKKWEVVAYM